MAQSESEYTFTEENYSDCSFQSTEFQEPLPSACDPKAIKEVSRVLGDWLETTWPAEGKALQITPTDEGILLNETPALTDEEFISRVYSTGYDQAVEDIDSAHRWDDPYLQGYQDALDRAELEAEEEEDMLLYNQGYEDALDDVELELEEKADNADPYLEGYSDALEDLMNELGLDCSDTESIASQDSLPSLVSISAQSSDTIIPAGYHFDFDNETESGISDADYDDSSSLACECEECLDAYEHATSQSESISEITLGETQHAKSMTPPPIPAKIPLEGKYRLEITDVENAAIREEYLSGVARCIEAHLPPAEPNMLPAFLSPIQEHIRKAIGNMEKRIEEFGIPYLDPIAAFTMEWRLVLWKEALAKGVEMTRDEYLAKSKVYEMMERVLKNDPKLTEKEIQKFEFEYVQQALKMKGAKDENAAGLRSVGDGKTEDVFDAGAAMGEQTCSFCGCARTVVV